MKLWYEETGAGAARRVRARVRRPTTARWEPQMRHFGQRYRCVTFSARGYPPSDVPEKPESYSQDRATDDIARGAWIISGSTRRMSSACRWAASPPCISASAIPTRALSLVVAGCGYGAEKEQQAKFRAEVEVVGQVSRRARAWPKFAEKYAYGPTRVQFENKDPRGFAEFKKELAEHSALGSANTQVGVQGQRPSLYDLLDKMRALTVPTLILTGDEDWPCLAPSAC